MNCMKEKYLYNVYKCKWIPDSEPCLDGYVDVDNFRAADLCNRFISSWWNQLWSGVQIIFRRKEDMG